MNLRLMVALSMAAICAINAGFAIYLFSRGNSWAFNGVAALTCGAVAVVECRRR